MKLFRILCIPIFLYFAYLQLNDPDPYLWFPLYAAVAAIALAGLFRKVPRFVGWILIPIYLVLAAYYFSQTPYFGMEVEEVREFLGLLIACAAIAVLVFKK
ncbi:transmembrane 220 family protein [Leptospira kanakyensis]|uniref:transmembrane 220 family protein n=1 Tax=Leptospira kanakyensis TaxID=2484968 RepID=UPI00223CAD8A|nr:transmembrane 220 family protein [Leptospira kanakyensis]MCW7481460.1 transmembrane 220 family protein [Leptospira kanakyensis]